MWWYALLGLLVIGYGSLIAVVQKTAARTRSDRKSLTVDAFENELGDKSYDREAIRAAFDDLVDCRGHPAFPKDDLKKTLGFLPEEFDDVVEERCRKQGVVDVWKSPYAALFPLHTVEDYVHFLSEVILGERAKHGS